MDNDFVNYSQIVTVVIELADMAEAELMARSRDGRFVGYTFLNDDDSDAAVWRKRDVFGMCWILFGSECAERVRAAWNISLPQPRKRKRGRRNEQTLPDWLNAFGKKLEDEI
jgi:hypothetical protein